MSKILGTIWICENCMLVHANGECGEIHAESCPAHQEYIRITHDLAGYDCDPHSRAQCEGCGTYLHGKRYAVTLWDDRQEDPDPEAIARENDYISGRLDTES